ncbi:unnamed protein product, partial [Prorocentrum cordatum]
MQQLWPHFDKRMYLAGVRHDKSSIGQEPLQMLQQLGAHWREVFTAKPFLADQAADLLQRHAPKLPQLELPPPSSHTLRKILDRVRPSALGPDNLPYEAWKNAPMGIEILTHSMRWMLEGFSLGAGFNAALGAFAPKGEEGDDGNGGLDEIQKGFVAGRNFGGNIIDLDVRARTYSMQEPSLHPILVGYDFGQ